MALAAPQVVQPGQTETELLIAGPSLAIREWRRRDRSASGRWPKQALPLHWTYVTPALGLPRTSYALDRHGELIGRLTTRDELGGSARVGLYLKPDMQGRGYGAEALRLFGIYARHLLLLTTLWADVACDNARSIRCFTRAGFQIVGGYDHQGHRYHDLLLRLQGV